MKTKCLLGLACVLLAGATVVSAQCKPDDQPCSDKLTPGVPQLDDLKSNLQNYLNAQPVLLVQPSSGASSPVIPSRFSTWDSAILNNLTFHVDGTYSDTLQRSQMNGSETLTPFQLTGVKFQPTVSLTYQVNLGQLTSARRQWSAALHAQQQAQAKAQWDRAVQSQAAFAELEKDYVAYEKLKAQFDTAQAAHTLNADAFYQLKAQALQVLNSAHYAEDSAQVETVLAQKWNVTPTPAPQRATSGGAPFRPVALDAKR
jgi:hypothetical protein